MEVAQRSGQYLGRQGPTPRPRSSTRRHPGHGPTQMETHRMSRYKDLALRLAVVVSFVLVLAAPLRW
jgi:hypothetical protein